MTTPNSSSPFNLNTMQLPLYEISNAIIQGGAYGYGIYGYGEYGYGSGSPGASIIMGPKLARVWWLPDTILCSTPSQALSMFYLYRNGTSQAQLIGTSLNGNADQVPFTGTPLTSGEFLVGQWVGGDNGAQATMTVTGSKQVPGPPIAR